MSEREWRGIGIQQSIGWVHYMIHEPEPHVILFRRPKSEVEAEVQAEEEAEEEGTEENETENKSEDV